MNSIYWQRRVLKHLRKLNQADQPKITKAVSDLSDLATCKNVKALVNHEYQYRLRVGNYRVFFNAETEIEIVYIEEVKKRDENTY